MVDISIREAYDASASDAATAQPSLRSSRPRKYRKVVNAKHPVHSRRAARWRKRTAERLKENNLPPSTSDEDENNPLHFLSTIPCAAASRSAPHDPKSALSKTKSIDVDASAIRNLPRPSDVVPGVECGSDSDIGLDKIGKETHKRRITATSIQLQYLGYNGRQQAVPDWKRTNQGLKKYNPFLVPPREDQFVKPYRVTPTLLSRHYRGSALAVYRPGRKTRFERRRLSLSHEKGDSCSDARSDFEFCGASSQFYTSTSDREGIKASKKTAHQVTTKPSTRIHCAETAAFIKAAKDPDAPDSDESDNTDDSDSSDKVTPVYQNETGPSLNQSGPNTNPQNKGKSEDAPFSQLRELFAMVKNDPDSLFETAVPTDPTDLSKENITTDGEVKKEGLGQEDKSADPEKGTGDENITNLSPFERDVRLAMKFCQGPRKRSRSTSQAEVRDQDRKRRPSSGTAVGEGELGNNLRDRMKSPYDARIMGYMEKMGFKGRLGAKEDGIAVPLSTKKSQAGRRGIGSQPIVASDVDDDSILPGKGRNSDHMLPVAFASKKNSYERSVDRLESKSTGINSDVYSRRREPNIDPGDQGAIGNVLRSGKPSTEDKPSTPVVVLDDDDEYETEREDFSFDNSRRAILVDIDVLIKNSRARRSAAFRKVVEQSKLLPGTFNVKGMLQAELRDLCDADCIKKIFHSPGSEPSDSTCDALMEELDAAYKAVEAPVLHSDLLNMLKAYSGEVYFGLFHRGSRGRMSHELDSLGLAGSFLQGPRSVVKKGDDWPYLETWQELLCRVGVGARQGLLFVKDDPLECSVLGGHVASVILGSRTMIVTDEDKGASLRLTRLQADSPDATCSIQEAVDNRSIFLDKFLSRRADLPKRRRVLALYSADGLWYCGWEQFGESNGAVGAKHGLSLILFHKYENREWIANKDVLPLPRKDFKRIRDADFPGLLAPEDVDDL